MNNDQTNNICPICYQLKAVTRLICGHLFCRTCLDSYFEIKIIDGDVLHITCPEPNCGFTPLFMIKNYVSDSVFKKYLKFCEVKELEKNALFRWCPLINCKGYDVYISTNKLTCRTCSYSFCYLCSEEWHENYCKALRNKGFLSFFIRKKVKFCPVCRVRTEKNGGCPTMFCVKCSSEWCWVCNKLRGDHEPIFCVLGQKWYNPSIVTVIAIAIAPVTMLFFPLILYLIGIDAREFERNNDRLSQWTLRHFKLSIAILILVSPIITMLALIAGLFSLSYSGGKDLLSYSKKTADLHRCLYYIIFVIVTILDLPLILILGITAFVLIWILGLLLLPIKLPMFVYSVLFHND